NPLWNLVGRVTFHLAENKADDKFPFAFLATYTHRLTPDGRLQYLPLGRALKTYADASDSRTLRTILAPVQHAADNSPFIHQLLDSRHVFQALAWTPDDAYPFLQAIPALEQAGVVVKVPDWWKNRTPSKPQVSVELEPPKHTSVGYGALLSFQLSVAVDGSNLSQKEIDQILASDAKLLSIKGHWIQVDRERLQQALDHWTRAQNATASSGISFLEAMRLLAGLPGLATASSPELEAALSHNAGWFQVTASPGLRAALDALHATRIDPGPTLHATLRPYQQHGLDWLAHLHNLRLGACLADDMGLGKTLQVIALLTHLKKSNPDHPSLLVVPASLVANWRAEFEKFAPSLNVIYAHRSQVERATLDGLQTLAPAHDAVVTTYSMLSRLPALTEQQWNLAVLDEAHAIKNPQANQTRTVKKLKTHHRVALTGTPVENSAGDLWSLFDFLNPGLLGSAQKFATATSHLARDDGPGYAPLRRLVAPYILRRLKTDRTVIADLPDKTEVPTFAPLTRGQATLYQQAVRHLAKQLAEKQDGGIDRSGLVLSSLLRFKQICDHPALTTGSGNFLEKDSGKFARLRTIAGEVQSRGEKMLVFSQFREITAPLADFLAGIFNRPGLVLHGGTAIAKRAKLVDAFQEPLGPPFFVISLKAGGTGLNLTAASHVVHFDRWWNPAVENQATDRAYRIGQKRNVLVHKFVCPGTIEEKIDALLKEKQSLADDLVAPTDSAGKQFTNLTTDQLLDLVSLDLDRAVF
ncbi:MAG: DEAD/DEAH box helicase, partial [Verrucomicrobiales bacterium]|nr:DEAD/DEAH box helicase [Verrucomicrobiales bacterium]